MTEPRIALVIPAAGAGARMGTRTPKQFLRIGRRSILEVTLGQFQAPPLVHEIVIALPEPHLPRARRLLGRHRPSHRPAPGLVVGGATRQESVWRALQARG